MLDYVPGEGLPHGRGSAFDQGLRSLGGDDAVDNPRLLAAVVCGPRYGAVTVCKTPRFFAPNASNIGYGRQGPKIQSAASGREPKNRNHRARVSI